MNKKEIKKLEKLKDEKLKQVKQSVVMNGELSSWWVHRRLMLWQKRSSSKRLKSKSFTSSSGVKNRCSVHM